jgi:hypothetical protein
MVKYATTTWMNKSSFCVKPNKKLLISHTIFNCKDNQHLDPRDDIKTQFYLKTQVTYYALKKIVVD